MATIEVTVGAQPEPVLSKTEVEFWYQASTNGEQGLDPVKQPWNRMVGISSVWLSSKGRTLTFCVKNDNLMPGGWEQYRLWINKKTITLVNNTFNNPRRQSRQALQRFILHDPEGITISARRIP